MDANTGIETGQPQLNAEQPLTPEQRANYALRANNKLRALTGAHESTIYISDHDIQSAEKVAITGLLGGPITEAPDPLNETQETFDEITIRTADGKTQRLLLEQPEPELPVIELTPIQKPQGQ